MADQIARPFAACLECARTFECAKRSLANKKKMRFFVYGSSLSRRCPVPRRRCFNVCQLSIHQSVRDRAQKVHANAALIYQSRATSERTHCGAIADDAMRQRRCKNNSNLPFGLTVRAFEYANSRDSQLSFGAFDDCIRLFVCMCVFVQFCAVYIFLLRLRCVRFWLHDLFVFHFVLPVFARDTELRATASHGDAWQHQQKRSSMNKTKMTRNRSTHEAANQRERTEHQTNEKKNLKKKKIDSKIVGWLGLFRLAACRKSYLAAATHAIRWPGNCTLCKCDLA